MTPYLSRAEMQVFIHLCATTVELKKAISSAEKKKTLDDQDKKYLKNIRTSYTFIKKAVDIRHNALDKENQHEVGTRLSHVDYQLLPSDKAQKEIARLNKLTNMVHMDNDDFLDWYCDTIPETCGKCQKSKYKMCRLRAILMKFGIWPVNPNAVGKCQYSYPGADIRKYMSIFEEEKEYRRAEK